VFSTKDIKLQDKKVTKIYKEYLTDPSNPILSRRLVYEINVLQDRVSFRLKETKVDDREYDILLDMSFKWNSIISLRRLPKEVFNFPTNIEKAKRNLRKIVLGKVVNNKMDKTVVILVTRKEKHPIYKKFVTKTKRYKVHDEYNSLNVGDTISAMECRPLSKDKSFRLYKIIAKAK